MKLSEIRIRKLAKEIAAAMIKAGAVKAAMGSAGRDAVADSIAKVMITDQRLDEQIEEEARAMVAKQRNLVPGTGEYKAAFDQARKTVMIRRGLNR